MANTDGKITYTTYFSTSPINISQKKSPSNAIKQCYKFFESENFKII